MKTSDSSARCEIGVDVSKDTLDVFDGHSTWQTANSSDGIKDLLKRIRKVAGDSPLRLTFEATGRYGDLLANACLKAGIAISIANARMVRDYAKSAGSLAKTDRLDARSIAAYAAHHNPATLDAQWTKRQKFVERYARMCSLIELVSAQKASLHQYHEAAVQAEIRKLILHLERRITAYEKEIDELIGKTSELAEKRAVLSKIKGVGKRTIQAVLVLMPELGKVNRGQAAALAGLAPMNCDSGKMRGKRIIQAGRGRVRKVLYMAALSASRYQPKLSEFSKRLREEGKAVKVVLCAIARKLIIQINTALKNLPA